MRNKALLAAGLLLGQAVASPFALAKLDQGQASGVVTGFVVPSEVGANEPFTFAATNVVEGDVVAIQTVDGEVVASKKTDRLGRIFLPAGLAAGAYLLSANGGKSGGSLHVQPPRNLPTEGGMTVQPPPGAQDIRNGLSLTGQGMSGNAAEMAVRMGKTDFPVLAGTATELKTGPLPASACGAGPIEVKNLATGATAETENVVAYQLSAKLARTTLAGGQQTALEFSFQPREMKAVVDARILGGPVSFAGGKKEARLTVENGTARLPLTADAGGKGSFQVAYDIHEILGAGKLDGSTFQPAQPGGAVGGENKQPAGNEKRKRCPKTRHIRDEADGWESSEKTVADPANPGKTKTIYVISRKLSCNVHKSCTRDEGHSGACNFTGKHHCKDHDMVETREFDTARERDDAKKDTSIPDKIKYP